MAFSASGRQWSVWKAAWEAEAGQPPNRAVPEGPAVEFLPEALDIQQTPSSPIGRALLWTILIACVTGACWTMLVKIDVVTMAQGRVVVSGDSKIIHPSEAGVLTAIHVKEGQAVKQGDVLIELDPTKKLAEVEPRRTRVEEYQRTKQADLSALEAKADLLEQAATKAERNANIKRVLSPIDGVVQQLTVHTIGAEVTPAQPLLMVAPLNRSVEVEAHVENKDVAVIRTGQPVGIRIETGQMIPDGRISGHVLRSSDETTSIKTSGSLSPIRVSLNRSTMRVGGAEIKLTPGMAVTVEIKTGQRRMIDYLVDPLRQSWHDRAREWHELVQAVRSVIERRRLS